MITKFPDIFLTKASCIWTLSCGGHEIHDVSVAGWPHISQQRAGRRLMGQPSRWATRSNWSRSAAGRCAGGRRPFNTFRWTFGLLGDRSHCVFNEVILSWIHLEFIVELVLSSVSRSLIRPAKYTHTQVFYFDRESNSKSQLIRQTNGNEEFPLIMLFVILTLMVSSSRLEMGKYLTRNKVNKFSRFNLAVKRSIRFWSLLLDFQEWKSFSSVAKPLLKRFLCALYTV